MTLKRSNLSKEDREYLLSKIDNEGFDYCFRDYSDWEGIEDEKFQELRRRYVEAANDLENYILRKGKKSE